MRFSGTSILGQWGQICFSEFLKIISSVFAQNFCTDRVDILLCSERTKNGGNSRNLAPLGRPPRSIVGVGDEHAHDSDHAECGMYTEHVPNFSKIGLVRVLYEISQRASRMNEPTNQPTNQQTRVITIPILAKVILKCIIIMYTALKTMSREVSTAASIEASRPLIKLHED